MARMSAALNPRGRGRAAGLAHGALAAMAVLAASAGYGYLSVFRNDRFGSNAFDLGDQDQTIWGYSHFEVIYNTVQGIPNLMGDHFHPILVVLAPLYWAWNTPDAILAAQALIASLGGVPVYLWAARQLGRLAGLAFLAAYLTFWGLQAGLIYDFHHVAFAVPGLSLALYGTLERRNLLLLAGVVICMLTREDVALTVAALGLYIALVQRRWVLGGLLAAVQIGWFLLLIRVVMPALAGTPYRHWTYQQLGSGPGSALAHVITHPLSSLELLFQPAQKVKVWLGIFGSWLFLPAVSPLLIVLLPSLLARFWSSETTLWSFHFQYTLAEAPILAFAAVDTTARLARLLGPRLPRLAVPVAAVAILLVNLVASFLVIRPLAEVTTYVSAARAAEIQSCLDVIPGSAQVTASNFLLPHLDHRAQIYLLPARPDADFIAIDVSTYHHFAPGEEQALRKIVLDSLSGSYGVACSRGETVILERGSSSKTLSPELIRWLAGACSDGGCRSARGRQGMPGLIEAEVASAGKPD